MIDPQEFMNQPAAPMETVFTVVPKGEYPFLIDTDPEQLVPKKIEWNDKNTGEPRFFYQWELRGVCQDEKVKAVLELERVTVRLRINLDLDESGGFLSGKNKNLRLGQLREALGQNTSDWKPMDLLGAGPFIGKVDHSFSKTNTELKYADIVAVAKIR